VGYCTVSEAGLITEANFRAAAMLGLSRSEMVHQPVSRFIVKEDQDRYYKCRKLLFEGGMPHSCELRMLRRDATPLWVSMDTSSAPDAAGVAVQRIVLSDITERKRLDGVLQTRNQELEAARALADLASQAKSNFLSNMTHELRSPLNAILGFAQLMEMGPPEPTPMQKANVAQILKAGWYLLDLIGEILDLNSIEAGHLALSMEALPLAEVLQDCQALMGGLAQKRNVVLDFPPESPAFQVKADRTRLKQVIVNLLSNAIKYNRAGGTVTVSCRRMAAQRLCISVQDTGRGLSNDQLALLFQPFNRLGMENSAEEGSGIGLAVSKRLVELMGGTIGARSSIGVGSEFWIEIDLADASAQGTA
jgi:PAS domain S-box-containing protein